jgi:hypothetical protein
MSRTIWKLLLVGENATQAAEALKKHRKSPGLSSLEKRRS